MSLWSTPGSLGSSISKHKLVKMGLALSIVKVTGQGQVQEVRQFGLLYCAHVTLRTLLQMLHDLSAFIMTH